MSTTSRTRYSSFGSSLILGAVREWFRDPGLDGVLGLGTTGIRYLPPRHEMLIAQQTVPTGTTPSTNGALYRLRLDHADRLGVLLNPAGVERADRDHRNCVPVMRIGLPVVRCRTTAPAPDSLAGTSTTCPPSASSPCWRCVGFAPYP